MTAILNPAGLFSPWTASASLAMTGQNPATATHALAHHLPNAVPSSSVPISRLWRPEIGDFSQAAAEDAGRVWARNGAPLNPVHVLALEGVVHGFLLHTGPQAVSSYRLLWDAIPYATSHTAYPRIATPEESVWGHLNGLRLLRDTWGVGVACRWREGDFDTPIRCDVGKSFFIEASPGSHETVAGMDYRLQWEGLDAYGKECRAVLALVGVIRHRDGFGITLTQGGPRLSQIKIDRNGKLTDLLKVVQGRFGNDPRAWLVRDVLRSLRQEYGDVPFYWLRAERRGALYSHLIDPDLPQHGMFAAVGHLSPMALRERVRRSPSPGAERLPATIRRMDAIAESLGFRGACGDTWWGLPRFCGG
jgi:hypothetical protein